MSYIKYDEQQFNDLITNHNNNNLTIRFNRNRDKYRANKKLPDGSNVIIRQLTDRNKTYRARLQQRISAST